jgi:hypothetical protein
VLVPLGNGVGDSEISDNVSLGGVNELPSLLSGNSDPGEGPGLTGGAPLDSPGVLGGSEVGDWLGTGDGIGLVTDVESSDAAEPSEPSETGETLGNGGGEPLGGGGKLPELSVLVTLGVVSDVAEDGCDPTGLVDAADGVETGEADGVTTLDGPSVDDVGGAEPELGWPDGGDGGLLPGVEAGDRLGADGPTLLGGADGRELGTGLIESPGLPDVSESDVSEPDVGEPDVGLTLDSSALAESGDAELGGVSLDAIDGVLLGASDEGTDWLGALDNAGLGPDEAIGLPESPELPDCGEADCWLPLDGPLSLEVGLADSCDTGLGGGLDPVDGALLLAVDDVAEVLSTLAELITDDCDSSEGALADFAELPDSTSLLRPLIEPRELVGDALSLAWLTLLASLCDADEIGLASDEVATELTPLDGAPELGADDSPELNIEGSDDVVLDSPSELEPIVLGDD